MYREFEEFVFNNFDYNEPAIRRKYYHSKRVSTISKKIAQHLSWPLKDVALATQIGLLHDIGRFEEWTMYKCFSKYMDHGSYGAYLLNKEEYEKMFNIKAYDKQEVLDAIYYHNKLKLPSSLKNNKFCKLIRDADKLDIIYQLSQREITMENNTNVISKEVFKEFNKGTTITNKYVKTYADKVLSVLALVYDINYNYTLELLYDFNYINNIYENLENKEFYKDYFDKINKYIEKRIKTC
ncbi:MAG: HD domain-containing protein [bacterium]|nr:HD domain-containing protein [bacterium]